MSCAKAIERQVPNGAATRSALAHACSREYHIDAQHVLGSGSYSVVRRAVDVASGAEVACKQLSNCSASITCLTREVTALRTLPPHPNIVQLRDLQRDSEHICLFLSSPRGAITLRNYLDEHVAPLDEHVVREIMRQLLGAVHHCHVTGVAHRDLKLENVLIVPHSLHVTLIDFGLALTEHDLTRVTESLGSPLYMAPEVLLRQTHCATTADMWSLGVILHQLLFRHYPYMADTLDELCLLVTRHYTPPSEEVREGSADPGGGTGPSPSPLCPSSPSPLCLTLLRALLSPAPLRISSAQAVLHPWFSCATPR